MAPLLKFEDKQNDLKPRYDRILAGVGDREVVLSDPETSWPVPSSAGRIVFANHLEFFTKGQKQRRADVEKFFAPGTPDADRLAILKRYDVRWILLSRNLLPPSVHDALMRPEAVVRGEQGLTLIDAKAWGGLAGSTR